jgi:starch synthase
VRVLHVASEIAPFSKTGGLADVLGALPGALASLGVEVTMVAPRYRCVDVEQFGLARRLSPLRVPIGHDSVEVTIYEGRPPGGSKARLYLVDHPESFDRDGLYGPKSGGDWDDNARRFAILGSAALEICARDRIWPDIVHGHDWQSGPALLYARKAAQPPRLVFTIHNLAYQGLCPPSTVEELGFGADLYHPDGIEFYGQVSLLKAGLVLADRITTVSPRYAQEIQTPEQGCGLDGFLASRAARLVGILNGVDYHVWNPEHDPALPASYSSANLDGKRRCKAELQREVGLPQKPHVPLCGSISRLAHQKGFDLVCGALPSLLQGDVQYVVLGSGDPELERKLAEEARQHPSKVAVRIAYDEKLAHRIEAGCDLYVMPSRYEPCGLNQMYSLRYGTPPIVRATGGLDDTIVDFDARSATGTGFKFHPYTVEALGEAWRRAILAYHSGPDFTALVRRAMSQDFSWSASARRYLQLYQVLAQ